MGCDDDARTRPPCHSSFQYPRTDRMGCDLGGVGWTCALLCLSVSSNGSNGLRRGHGRVIGQQRIHFQYPRTDRMGCDGKRRNGRRPPPRFQYPRTDRMGCDTVVSFPLLNFHETFSILERIEWAATLYQSRTMLLVLSLSVSSNGSNGLRHRPAQSKSVKHRPFSILERIEWAATTAVFQHRESGRPFSILERIEWAATSWPTGRRLTKARLSVSSNGSNGLRPRRGLPPLNAPHPFSILERIEWAATETLCDTRSGV